MKPGFALDCSVALAWCFLDEATTATKILDLAMRRHVPLATLDEPLRKAAKKMGVKLLGL